MSLKDGKEARQRQPDLSAHYGRSAPMWTPGEVQLRVSLIDPVRGTESADLSALTPSVSWDDSNEKMAGQVTLQRPVADDAASLPVGLDSIIAVRARRGMTDPLTEIFQMQSGLPEIDSQTGTLSVTLEDDLVALSRNVREWTFRHRKRGYSPELITREVCRREHVKLGPMPASKSVQKKVEKTASGLQLILDAWKNETAKTDLTYIVRRRAGQLEVVPYRRGYTLILISREVQNEMAISQKRKANPTTVLEARGRVGRGKAGRKVKATISQKDIVARYGYRSTSKDFGQVDSLSDLREQATRELARQLLTQAQVDVTVPGVPWLRRGDSVLLLSDEVMLRGRDLDHRDRRYMWLTGASHSMSGGEYTTQLALTQEDPFFAYREKLDKTRRDDAKKKKKK